MSITPREDQVMDLWDQGKSRAAIAAALGLDQRAVDKIINYMHEAGDRQQLAAIRQGTHDLAQAINAARATA